MLPRSRQDGENIRVLSEADARQGWLFVVALPGDCRDLRDPGECQIELTMSWQDYEYWCHGMKSPSYVAEVVVRALMQAQPDRVLPARFDASTARRWVRDLDERMREEL